MNCHPKDKWVIFNTDIIMGTVTAIRNTQADLTSLLCDSDTQSVFFMLMGCRAADMLLISCLFSKQQAHPAGRRCVCV